MPTNDIRDYRGALSEIIKKQMSIVGPSVAISIVQKVPSIKVAPNGDVLEIVGDPKAALGQVAEAYINFSGEISKLILKSVIKIYPDVEINNL